MGIKSRTFDIPSSATASRSAAAAETPAQGEKAIRVKLTDKERKKVEKMIREAKSLQEITKLEKELNEGKVPGGSAVDVDGESEDEEGGGDKMEM